ncbi:hypothetical protein AMECASPLE_014899 [Ameca splendens]|uniref:Uncharacterized protein n=1 Tax=Ameca splendens TaxID=208324 RepID=A0ABV0ZXI5_9TELE
MAGHRQGSKHATGNTHTSHIRNQWGTKETNRLKYITEQQGEPMTNMTRVPGENTEQVWASHPSGTGTESEDTLSTNSSGTETREWRQSIPEPLTDRNRV